MEQINNRVNTLYGFVKGNRLTFREVATEAGFEPQVIYQQLHANSISSNRLEKLEDAAIKLKEQKAKPSNQKVSKLDTV